MDWLLWLNSPEYFTLLAGILTFVVLPLAYVADWKTRKTGMHVELNAKAKRKTETFAVFSAAIIAFALLATIGFMLYKNAA